MNEGEQLATHLVTGAAGFLGRQLVLELLHRHARDRVVALVRDGEDELRGWLDARRADLARLEVIRGEVTAEQCGVAADQVSVLSGERVHMYHTAARYDLARADAAQDEKVNVEGTRRALELAKTIAAASFAHVSTVMVAGRYQGIWTEEHYEEAPGWPTSYASSKHRAELLVRDSSVPVRGIYRLGVLVGDASTGSHFKEDGVYGFFEAIRSVDRSVPRGLPLPTIGWGPIPLCPVDHAARAVVALAANADRGLAVHHVFEDDVLRADEIMRLVLEAAGRERILDLAWVGHAVQDFNERAEHDTVLTQLRDDILAILRDAGIPQHLLAELHQPTQFSNDITSAHLRELGIESTMFTSYVSRIWYGWLAHRMRDACARRRAFFSGKHVVMTGGSSGIGAEMLRRMLDSGVASVVVLGRHAERVASVVAPHPERERVEHLPCDLLDPEDVTSAVDQLLSDDRPIDVLVLSAGLSIDRRLLDMTDDLNELARMTQVNFLAPTHLIRGLVPLMEGRPDARVVTISTISTQLDVPGFSVYAATKAALDRVFSVLPAELAGKGISFVTVRLPLVKTPMTDVHVRLRDVPMLSVGRASEIVLAALETGDARAGTWLGSMFEVLQNLHPELARALSSIGWRAYLRTPYFARLVDAQLRRNDA
ncbi:SDR family NAD(P)-dependent oxidoreductase [Nocardioides zeae]|uniref:SDR family NAD(P)-dependent oxidoreductase n=1 Tax=Nocardioides zeae TaxID=1457234 RepID=A0A6P0HMN5_9ACTN|nr:SDR family NAD(P)-dependent oxidoreductase [Nocardioides zeae]